MEGVVGLVVVVGVVPVVVETSVITDNCFFTMSCCRSRVAFGVVGEEGVGVVGVVIVFLFWVGSCFTAEGKMAVGVDEEPVSGNEAVGVSVEVFGGRGLLGVRGDLRDARLGLEPVVGGVVSTLSFC